MRIVGHWSLYSRIDQAPQVDKLWVKVNKQVPCKNQYSILVTERTTYCHMREVYIISPLSNYYYDHKNHSGKNNNITLKLLVQVNWQSKIPL